MKTLLKVLGGIVLVVVALVGIALIWLSVKKPASRPASTEKVEATPARLARGKYLVENVSNCLECHSDHLTTYAFPIKPGTEGQGGFIFDEKLGFPGAVAAQNLTPDPETGLGNWTDGEILRAMREGVDRKGDGLFPMMPYVHFRHMSDEDANSVVVYIRTLKPIRNTVPAKHLNFPLNLISKFFPKPLDGPVPEPNRASSVAYGQYLARIGGCYECHTPHKDKGGLDESRPFAGGWEMKGEWGRVNTANITPAPHTFIGQATKEQFIGRFRAFAGFTAQTSPAAPPGRNTVMPWISFAKMTDEDLGAIYDYLKTVKPDPMKVVTFPDAK